MTSTKDIRHRGMNRRTLLKGAAGAAAGATALSASLAQASTGRAPFSINLRQDNGEVVIYNWYQPWIAEKKLIAIATTANSLAAPETEPDQIRRPARDRMVATMPMSRCPPATVERPTTIARPHSGSRDRRQSKALTKTKAKAAETPAEAHHHTRIHSISDRVQDGRSISDRVLDGSGKP